MDIKIVRTDNPKIKPDPATLGFGKKFSDHMFIMEYDRGTGWHDARIVPYGKVELYPSAAVFHYGAEIFEGLKAYRTPDGGVQLFRPMENIRRMNNSAERIALPQIDEDFFLKALTTFVDVERDWVPSAPDTTLYLRPFMYASEEALGVHSISQAVFMIIASPVGKYYKEGINPVKIMIETADVRAVRGGTGYAKCGGNYAASNRAGERAEKLGFSQVLWLDGVERKYIEEVGAMNVMFKVNGTIVTPALTGSILPGVTRKSCIDLLRDWGYTVEERLFSFDELKEALANGTLEEAWGCGTAAVVSPIGLLYCDGVNYTVNDGKIGEVTQKLYDRLTGIQFGKLEDKFGWTMKV